ncbi:MAG: hypothetical protein DRJ05_07930, partial [Bacteroidetes bacterium]
NANPTLSDSQVQVGSGTGFFSTAITGLNPDTEYFLRAYATNSEGTAYGNELSFTTQTSGSSCPATITDADGNTYNTVLIGTQCWMAENLNVGNKIDASVIQTDNGIIEKYCYDNLTSNCDGFGGFYRWDEMMEYETTEGAQGICPVGWHIPTEAEWCELENEADAGTVDCDTPYWRGTDCGGNLKQTGTTYWYSPNVGATNSSGFTALPTGYYGSGYFSNYSSVSANWWSSNEYDVDDSYAWCRGLSYFRSTSDRHYVTKGVGFSIRCLKD